MVTLRTHKINALGTVAHSIGRAILALGGRTLGGSALAGAALARTTLGRSSLGAIVGSRLLKRGLAARMGFGALPLLTVGLAVWGYRAWRRQQQRESLLDARKQLPLDDPKPPRDRVDESSWESFPASDPPSFTPKNARSGAVS